MKNTKLSEALPMLTHKKAGMCMLTYANTPWKIKMETPQQNAGLYMVLLFRLGVFFTFQPLPTRSLTARP